MGFDPHAMDYEHAHIGAVLRAARESEGESLNSVAAALHVQTRYIRAIEALDKDALPSLGYVLGYVRSYAIYLGLDAKKTVSRFKADIDCPKRLGISGDPHYIPKRNFRMPRGSFAAITALSCAAVVVTWYGWKSDANSAPAVLTDAPVPASARTPVQPPAQNFAFAPIQPKQNDPDSISLKAIGPSWVHVTDKDGLVLLSRVMVPGEIFETRAEHKPLVNVRDAGALELYLGGALQGPLGAKGESLKAVPLLPNSPDLQQ